MPRQTPGLAISLVAFGFLVVVASSKRREQLEQRFETTASRLRSLASRLWPVSLQRRWVWLAAISMAVVLAMGVLRLRFGARELLLPPTLGPGLDVEAELQGTRSKCERSLATGNYSCPGLTGVKVATGLGATPRGDSTWEYARLWPAIHVALPGNGALARLKFARVSLPQDKLELELRSSASVALGLSLDGKLVTTEQVASGNRFVRFDLPPHSKVATLELSVSSASAVKLEVQRKD
jgi:hypothetical protein